jgi:uncharacterized protein (DUF58 family)
MKIRHRDTSDRPTPADAAAIVRQARRLRFRVRRGAVADLAGAYLGARPGTGLAFSELRAYEPGDDVRHIDWNVTARQGKPYVRRFVEERALTLQLIVDVSASLRFGPEGRSKADRAMQAAALLATAAIQNGDRAGVILVSDRVEAELAPAGGPRHLARLVRTLIVTPAASRRTSLVVGIGRLRRRSRRALVVVLSDFLDASTEPVMAWSRAARRNDVVACRIVEPREDALPDAGLARLVDAELGTHRLVDTTSRKLRSSYAEAAEARRVAFRKLCASAGLTAFELSTAADPIGPLIRFFAERARSRGGRRP